MSDAPRMIAQEPAPTAMDLINDTDCRLEIIRTLADLAELCEGSIGYEKHVLVCLAIIATETRHIERSMTVLTEKFRHCLEEDRPWTSTPYTRTSARPWQCWMQALRLSVCRPMNSGI